MDSNIKTTIKKIIFRYLDSNKDKVFVFGSRAAGKARKFSDIDIGIISDKKIPWLKLSLIEEEFENSDLPFTVDIVDFRSASERFRKLAGKQIISLN